jgi:hypothetical protein
MRVAINSKTKATARAGETLEDINRMGKAKEAIAVKVLTEISHRAPGVRGSKRGRDCRFTLKMITIER